MALTAEELDIELWDMMDEQERADPAHFFCGACYQEKLAIHFPNDERTLELLQRLATACEDARQNFTKKFVRYGHFSIRLLNLVDTKPHIAYRRSHDKCACATCKDTRKTSVRYRVQVPYNICTVCEALIENRITEYYELFYPDIKEPCEDS